MSELKGIDISHWQAGLNLATLSPRPDFVLVKATGGKNYVDQSCDGFVQQAIKLGMCWGFYHFAHDRGYQGSAIEEADNFVRNCENYFGHGIPVLDWESDNKYDVTWAHTWLKRVYEKTGVKPIVYTTFDVENNCDWSQVVSEDYGLWIAYPLGGFTGLRSSDEVKIPRALRHWGFATAFQYSWKGRLAGWGGDLDFDLFYGDRTAWQSYAAKHGESQLSDGEIEKLAREVIAGSYGNGEKRRIALGKNYDRVQARVDEIYKNGYITPPTVPPAPPAPPVEPKPAPAMPPAAPPAEPVAKPAPAPRHAAPPAPPSRGTKATYLVQDAIRWITPARRKAVYKLVKYVLLGFAGYGLITTGSVETATHAVDTALDYAPELLGALAMILADTHTPTRKDTI